MTFRIALMVIVVLASRGAAQVVQNPHNIYDVLLHSSSLCEQRAALATVLATPCEYVPRIRQTLQTYPKQLEKDRVAANRAVYVAALVRDASFIPILVKLLDDPNVLDECIYGCSPVFALSVYANFGGWKIPANLNSSRATVSDLRSSMQWVSRLTLEQRPHGSIWALYTPRLFVPNWREPRVGSRRQSNLAFLAITASRPHA